MASTITRDTWTNDSGTAANPVGDGTLINNNALQNNIYARIDELMSGAGSYANLTLGGSLTLAAQPHCWVNVSAAQSVPNTTDTALLFDTEITDPQTMHSTAALTSRITIPASQGGWYFIGGQGGFAADAGAAGERRLSLMLNGTTKYARVTQPGLNMVQVFSVWMLYPAVAGDYFELIAYQSSGGNLNVGSGTVEVGNSFWAVKLF